MKNLALNLWHFFNANLPLNVMVVGKSISTNKKNYHIQRQTSKFYALEYLQSGQQYLSIDDKIFQVKANSVILLPKNTVQEYYCKNEENYLKKWFVFDGKYVKNIIEDYLPDSTYVFEGCNLSDHFDRIIDIAEQYKNDYETLTDKISIIILEIIIAIKNSFKRNFETLSQRIKDYIDTNIEKNLTLDLICEKFNYSKNHIIRIFKTEFALTPYQYILNKKICVAKQYLSNTNISIKEICKILNIDDQHYFSNIFKEKEGISPLGYRGQFKII